MAKLIKIMKPASVRKRMEEVHDILNDANEKKFKMYSDKIARHMKDNNLEDPNVYLYVKEHSCLAVFRNGKEEIRKEKLC